MKHILVISDFLKEEKLISNHRHREISLEIARYSHEVDSKLRFFYNQRFLNDISHKKAGIALYAGQIRCISQLGIYGIGLSLQENIDNAVMLKSQFIKPKKH